MARKQRPSIIGRLGHAAGDIADAVSVAATGSQIGVLELAAEDEFNQSQAKPARKARKKAVKKTMAKKKAASKKKVAVKKRTAPKKSAKKAAKKSKRR